jgi:NAD(P)-dependent dehydrogenase (short-subunit alcohol dehydrogenase family)
MFNLTPLWRSTMTTAHPLQNKVAFIQGGSRGIGAAIVKRLAREGATVAFTYVASAEKADALVGEISATGGKALAIKADSADASALQQAVRQAVNSLGNLDILVNNAGRACDGQYRRAAAGRSGSHPGCQRAQRICRQPGSSAPYE